MIYLVIPVFNRRKYTEACLHSIRKQTYTDYKVVVVDHGSTDDTSKMIEEIFPEVTVLKGNDQMWWAAATNMGVQYAIAQGASKILTLNNDLTVLPDYLEQLVQAAHQDPKAITGSVSLKKEDPSRVLFAGIIWNAFTAKYKPAVNLQMSYNQLKQTKDRIASDLLPGRGTLIPVTAFKDVGLFDEVRFPHYAADEDFSLRAIAKGYTLQVALKACVLSESLATGIKGTHQKRNGAFWRDTFFSQKSPNRLATRWLWAKAHARIPVIYFMIDVSRIIFSQFKRPLNDQ